MSRWSTAVCDDDHAELRAECRRLEWARAEVERELREATALIEALEAEVRLLSDVVTRRRLAIPADVDAGTGRERLLVRARTLVRRALHPDARPSAESALATRQFQSAEALFDGLLGER